MKKNLSNTFFSGEVSSFCKCQSTPTTREWFPNTQDYIFLICEKIAVNRVRWGLKMFQTSSAMKLFQMRFQTLACILHDEVSPPPCPWLLPPTSLCFMSTRTLPLCMWAAYEHQLYTLSPDSVSPCGSNTVINHHLMTSVIREISPLWNWTCLSSGMVFNSWLSLSVYGECLC